MSREVRRVPADWVHPRTSRRAYQPMYDEDYETAATKWLANCDAWRTGTHPDCADHKADHPYWWDWDGMPPDREYYRPKWSDEERTHYMMYETTSEGTPISPAFATPEELARWLADTKASAFAGEPASYESWLVIAKGGYAPIGRV